MMFRSAIAVRVLSSLHLSQQHCSVAFPASTATLSSLSSSSLLKRSIGRISLLSAIGNTMTTMATSPHGAARDLPFRIGYASDVEGNFEYFQSIVNESNIIDFVNKDGDDTTTTTTTTTTTSSSSTLASSSHQASPEVELSLRDGCIFVYGGDVVDKGPADIRVCRALVALKKAHPDRVFLIVGNRDLNKLRFTAELAADDMERKIDDIPPPHWDLNGMKLRQFMDVQQPSKINTRVTRIQYMLQCTLGCPDTFEFRRQELSILNNKSLEQITDEEVVDNFLYEIEHPDGSLRQYMENANVAVRIGNTIFCHGAIDRNTMQFVPAFDSKFHNPPSCPEPGQMCSDVDEWVGQLNEYLRCGWLDYLERPNWNKDRTSRGGESLIALQNRPAMWGRSIVSNSYGDGGCITTEYAASVRNDPERIAQESTNPLVFEGIGSDPMDQDVADWLLSHGVQRIVVGHKPIGDCPAVLSATYTGVEIVSTDTSYSDTTAADNRGKVLPLIEISGESEADNAVRLYGVLRDGSTYDCIFPRLYGGGEIDMDGPGDAKLGKMLAGSNSKFWVKVASNTEESGFYLLCTGGGRTVKTVQVPLSSINGSMEYAGKDL